MVDQSQLTLFALDCGATNWRLYRVAYDVVGISARMLAEPQPAPLTSFVDRRLPAVICLNPEGTNLESFGEVAQQQLEDERSRERVREHFKPCIGAHLEKNPLPHQKRYTHSLALGYTQMLLRAVLKQIQQEKWRSAAFDDRVCFAFAYPVHWRYEHNGDIFEEFTAAVRACFNEGFEGIRFVAEPEGAILCLQHCGLLGPPGSGEVTLIIDIGGSTTDIVAGQVEPNGRLSYIGRYGEPFGGGLYDVELAKHIADELKVPASALSDDPSAFLSLRVSAQRLKESLSRQLLGTGQVTHVPQRTITLVMQNGKIYRRVIVMDEARFRAINAHLDARFEELLNNALSVIALREANIGQVVLVGGGSQLFTLNAHLRERFGADRVMLADNPDEIVVQGIGLEYGTSMERIEPTIQFPAEAGGEGKAPETVSPIESSWWLVGEDGKEIPVHDGITMIGRGEGNAVQIDDLKVSRFHAELHTAGDILEVVDLGSTNGTLLKGRRLLPHEPQAVASGNEIIFGKTKYVLKH